MQEPSWLSYKRWCGEELQSWLTMTVKVSMPLLGMAEAENIHCNTANLNMAWIGGGGGGVCMCVSQQKLEFPLWCRLLRLGKLLK